MSERKGLDQVEIGVRLPSGKFIRNIFIEIPMIKKMRKRYGNKGVYLSAYCYEDAKNKTADSLLYGHLYIDLDISDLKDVSIEDEAFEKIREDGIKTVSFLSAIFGIDEQMIKIYYSGQKGLHIIVSAKIIGLRPMKELNHVYRLIAIEIEKMSKYKTIDTQIYDNARLFSLPGVRHPETGRYKIPLTMSELRTLSFQDIKKLSSRKRKVVYKKPQYSTKAHRIFQTYVSDWEKEKKDQEKMSRQKGNKTLSFCPPCIKSILNRECPQGVRNNTSAALSSYFKQRGYSKSKGWKLISEWNDRYANLPKQELLTTFNSIYGGEYIYGCSTLEQIGDCDWKNCKIGQKRN